MSRLYNRSSDIKASLRPRTNMLPRLLPRTLLRTDEDVQHQGRPQSSYSDVITSLHNSTHTTHSPVRSPRELPQVPLCHVSPTPSSQTLIPMSPCKDATMRPVKRPTYSAVRLHQRAEVARCSPVSVRKRGDEAVQEELHSPTFPPVLGLCQMNAVPPPLSL